METSVKSEEQEEEFVDSSSDSILLDDWQDLSKSDYAKVIFCDLYHHPESGGVGCKFQITDNVHEDPCDWIGLFRVGYENLSQCLVSKMLSNTECEEDGKLLRCVFSSEEIPDLVNGFYQFLYVTRDQEVCGASMPFEIKRTHPKDETTSASDDDTSSDRYEDGFILVQHELEKKNQILESQLEKYQSEINFLTTDRDKTFQEKDNVISNLNQEILALKARQQSLVSVEAQLQEKLSKEKCEASVLQIDKIRLQESVKDLHSQVMQEKCLKEKILREKEEAIFLTNTGERELVEQLEDQKFMIRALEDSKQLALKEMNDLSQSLSRRNKALAQIRAELASYKSSFEESTMVIIKQKENIHKLKEETNQLYQVLGEKEDRLLQQAAKIAILEKAEANWGAKETEYTKQNEDIHKLKEEMEQLFQVLGQKEDLLLQQSTKVATLENEATNWATKEKEWKKEKDVLLARTIERQEQFQCSSNVDTRQNLLQDVMTKVSDLDVLICKLTETTNFEDEQEKKAFFEVKTKVLIMMSKMRKPEIVANERKPGPVYYDTGSSTSGRSSAGYSSRSTAYVVDSTDEEVPRVVSSTSNIAQPTAMPSNKKNNKYVLKRFCILNPNDFENLNSEDVTFVNKLTEKVMKRKPLIMDADSVTNSESGNSSDNGEAIPNCCDMMRLERVLSAFKGHLHNNNEWGKLIESSNSESSEQTTAALTEMETELFMNEIKLHYQTEILLEYIRKQERKAEKAWKKIKDLESENMDLEVKIQTMVNAEEPKEAKFKEEIMKKDAIIFYLSTEKDNLLKEKVDLQKVNEEHSSRLADAAELYKKQYLEIQNLKKKMRRSGSKSSAKANGYVSSSTAEDVPLKTSEKPASLKRLRKTSLKSLKTKDFTFLPLSAQVIASLGRNFTSELKLADPSPFTSVDRVSTPQSEDIPSSIVCSSALPPSDSDTGEHVLGNMSDKPSEVASLVDKKETPIAVNEHAISCPEVQDSVSAQKFFSEELSKVRSQTPHEEIGATFIIPCIICDKDCTITATNEMELMDHLENEHQINMCPVCGQFFEAFVPKKYFIDHVNFHFVSD